MSARFFSEVGVVEVAGGFAITLDARALKTPGGGAFAAPTRALADACAAEWEAQGAQIVPATMKLTQLAFAALDWTANNRTEHAAYVASFGETDLCCHRADGPTELVARQAGAWEPLVAWGAEALGVSLPVVIGIRAAAVPAACIKTLRTHAEALDDFALTALTQATGLSGSALIGFALLRGRLDAEAAFAAAALDDLWNLEHWGEDGEARARLAAQRSDFDALARFIVSHRCVTSPPSGGEVAPGEIRGG